MARRSSGNGYLTPPRNLAEYTNSGDAAERFTLRPLCYRSFQLLMHSRCLVPNASSLSPSDTRLLQLLEESIHLMLASGCTRDEIVEVMAECTCLVDKLVLSPHKTRLFDEQEWVHVIMICVLIVFLNVKSIQTTRRELVQQIWHSALFGAYCSCKELEDALTAVLLLLDNDTRVSDDFVQIKRSILLVDLLGGDPDETGNLCSSNTK